jgi:hypothetical protein
LFAEIRYVLCSVAIGAAQPHILKRARVREWPDRPRVDKRRNGVPKSGKTRDFFPCGRAIYVGALAAATSMAPQHASLIWSSALALAGTDILLAHHLTARLLAASSVERFAGQSRAFSIAGLNSSRDQNRLS